MSDDNKQIWENLGKMFQTSVQMTATAAEQARQRFGEFYKNQISENESLQAYTPASKQDVMALVLALQDLNAKIDRLLSDKSSAAPRPRRTPSDRPRSGPREGGFRSGPREGGFRSGPRSKPRDGSREGSRSGPRSKPRAKKTWDL